MNRIPEKLRRQFSTDEQLRRYFARLERELYRRMQLARIIQLGTPTSPGDRVLQVAKVIDTGDGLVVYVR